jgi:hypothetical protein
MCKPDLVCNNFKHLRCYNGHYNCKYGTFGFVAIICVGFDGRNILHQKNGAFN